VTEFPSQSVSKRRNVIYFVSGCVPVTVCNVSHNYLQLIEKA